LKQSVRSLYSGGRQFRLGLIDLPLPTREIFRPGERDGFDGAVKIRVVGLSHLGEKSLERFSIRENPSADANMFQTNPLAGSALDALSTPSPYRIG
jgi:hypothetical protein